VDGHGIAELSSMEVGDLVGVVRSIKGREAAPIVASLVERLGHLVDIDLDYLSLDRETDTLSGGESQRVKIVKHLGSSLVDVMYIFDEPSIGMHPRDVHRMNDLLVKLRDKGNTVLVVEHDPDVIQGADHVVDLGPGAASNWPRDRFRCRRSEARAARRRSADAPWPRHSRGTRRRSS
jgi:excinuclease UvrABC ATPase subunit